MNFATELPKRALIQLEGPDKVSFLQGLITNDVTTLEQGKPIYAALLTPQGKFLFDLFIFQIEDVFLIDCERERTSELIKRLSMYKLRSKVEITDLRDTYKVFAVSDKQLMPNEIQIIDPRLKELGYRLYTKNQSIDLKLSNNYENHRISLGVPDGSRDIPIDKGVILEYGFDELQAIDWKKGCYMGQELTARTRYRGLVRKRLLPVKIEGESPPPFMPIFLGDTEVGEMRSSASECGLALLRLGFIRDSLPKLTCGNSQLTPYIPNWVKLPAAEE
ncbi:MAG: folate-binding protein [Alphaproteobacteria bacterium]|jgi:tRNA-modifying protein YgfZ|nr:folate-binding protein [Alphaproteobacteria bacterium]